MKFSGRTKKTLPALRGARPARRAQRVPSQPFSLTKLLPERPKIFSFKPMSSEIFVNVIMKVRYSGEARGPFFAKKEYTFFYLRTQFMRTSLSKLSTSLKIQTK